MVVDTSAIVAFLGEPDGLPYLLAAQAASYVLISSVSFYETRLVLTGRAHGSPRYDPRLYQRFLDWMDDRGVEVVPFDIDQAILAHKAYLRFGKGFHPAALNLADCTAYALAKLRTSRSCSRATTSPRPTSGRHWRPEPLQAASGSSAKRPSIRR
jgi:ribonuclease VapC